MNTFYCPGDSQQIYAVIGTTYDGNHNNMFVEVVNNMRKKLDRWGTKDYNVQVCEYRDANQSLGEHLNYRFI